MLVEKLVKMTKCQLTKWRVQSGNYENEQNAKVALDKMTNSLKGNRQNDL